MKPKRLFTALPLLMALVVGSLPSAHSATPDDLAKLDQEIAQLRQEISRLRGESQTLEDQLQLLAAEIEHTDLSLQSFSASIKDLTAKVADIDREINARTERINRERTALTELLRAINRTDAVPPVARLLADNNEDLSSVFAAAGSDAKASRSVSGVVRELHSDIGALEEQRSARTQALGEQEELQRVTQLAHEELLAREKQRADLLVATRGRQSEFEKLTVAKQHDAARIRTELYFLEDLGRGLPFEQALQLAKIAAHATNVRPALLLAVLQKESHLGASVGSGNWRDDMHPRDWDAFFQITQELGMNPDTTPVSKKPSYGWGGAMGPAQFLPTTWLGWKDRIAHITNHNPPSPWDIGDAFVAAGLKLSDGGAIAQTYDTEWKAAMIYFAGGNWDKPQYAFYGDGVMALADYFQEQISVLEKDSSTHN